MSSESSTKRERINARLDRELLAWARKYAEENGTTLTAVIEDGLRLQKKVEEEGGGVEAPQI
jgi:hypothetical protein